MKPLRVVAAVGAYAIPFLVPSVFAQTSTGIPPSILTPDKVETRLGTLNFKDGAPSADTTA